MGEDGSPYRIRAGRFRRVNYNEAYKSVSCVAFRGQLRGQTGPYETILNLEQFEYDLWMTENEYASDSESYSSIKVAWDMTLNPLRLNPNMPNTYYAKWIDYFDKLVLAILEIDDIPKLPESSTPTKRGRIPRKKGHTPKSTPPLSQKANRQSSHVHDVDEYTESESEIGLRQTLNMSDLISERTKKWCPIRQGLEQYRIGQGPMMVPVDVFCKVGEEKGQRAMSEPVVIVIEEVTMLDPLTDLPNLTAYTVSQELHDWYQTLDTLDDAPTMSVIQRRYPDARWGVTGGQHQWYGIYRAWQKCGEVKRHRSHLPSYLYVFPDEATANKYIVYMVQQHQTIQDLHTTTSNIQNIRTARAMLLHAGYKPVPTLKSADIDKDVLMRFCSVMGLSQNKADIRNTYAPLKFVTCEDDEWVHLEKAFTLCHDKQIK